LTSARHASQINTVTVEPEQQPTFTSFPKNTLLESGKIPIAEITGFATRAAQSTNPIYRVHHFVRRLDSQS